MGIRKQVQVGPAGAFIRLVLREGWAHVCKPWTACRRTTFPLSIGTLQFYIEEGRGHVDYLGYVRPKAARDDTDDADRLVSVQFAWKGEEKNVSWMPVVNNKWGFSSLGRPLYRTGRKGVWVGGGGAWGESREGDRHGGWGRG